MNEKVNFETGERQRGVVHKPVTIRIGAEIRCFTVYLPPYIAEKLTPEDWQRCGEQLKPYRDAIVSNSIIGGDWFCTGGVGRAIQMVKGAMDDLVYARFKEVQVAAGETAWIVPSLLQGERYAI
jgi:hypothetical protein